MIFFCRGHSQFGFSDRHGRITQIFWNKLMLEINPELERLRDLVERNDSLWGYL